MIPADEIRRGGLTLAEVAGIEVALAEGHPESEVFAQEGTDADTFEAAEQAWRHELLRHAEEATRFAELVAIAEEHQKRAVAPFESELRAWVALLVAGRRAGSLLAASDALGLRRGDVSRLLRTWQARLATDASLGHEIRGLLGRVGAPPAAQCEKPVLRPYPWSRNGSGSAAPPPRFEPIHRLVFSVDGALPAERDPEVYASLVATSEAMPTKLVRALELCGLLESDWDRLRAAWRERLANDPEARAIFNAKLADHRALATSRK